MKRAVPIIIIFSFLFLSACDLFKAEQGQPEKKKDKFENSKPKKAESQMSILKKRYNDLVALNEKLGQKKEEILELHENFLAQIENLEEEIRDIVKSENIEFYSQALGNQRIKYNLKLLQQKKAYLKKMTEFHERLLLGSEEVLFLTRKTESDLQVAQVLDEREIERLVQQIKRVVKNYLPYADQLAIKISSEEMETEKAILKTILEGNDQTKAQSKKITNKGRHLDRYRIIRLIEKGEMDSEWYFNPDINPSNIESLERPNKHCPNPYYNCLDEENDFWKHEGPKAFSVSYQPVLEKIIFLKPYIILGVKYTGFSEESHRVYGELINFRGEVYEPIKIIWEETRGKYTKYSMGNYQVYPRKGEIKRVYYIFEYDNPENFKTASFYWKGGKDYPLVLKFLIENK